MTASFHKHYLMPTALYIEVNILDSSVIVSMKFWIIIISITYLYENISPVDQTVSISSLYLTL